MQSPWMFINYLTTAQNIRKLSDNIANTANLTNNGLTNELTRLTLAATGIDLLARRGISLADIRPTKVSVSWTSKWLMLQALETFFGFFHDVPPFKLFGFMSEARIASWRLPATETTGYSVISLQATESVDVHDVLQVLVKCFAEMATRQSAVSAERDSFSEPAAHRAVSGDESQQWWQSTSE